jgi:tetratricopeptide (TPR) repeat protein
MYGATMGADQLGGFPVRSPMSKSHILFVGLALAVFTPSHASDDLDVFLDQQTAAERKRASTKAPELDPKRIINESNSFLKEREPEMTSEEYALYEKIVAMLTTNVDLALRLLEAMTNEKEPPSPAFEFILGNAYYAANQPEKAEARYRSSVKRFPTFLRAWNNLGVLYYTTQRYKEAVECFSKSVTLGDRDPTTFGLLAFSLERESDPISAEMAYMQALSGDPANSDWKEGLLRIYIEGRQFGRAEPLVKKLIKDHPADARLWLTYANILLAQDRKIGAIAVLEAAVGTGAAGTEELGLLGDLYAEQKLTDEALSAYAKIYRDSPDLGERKLLHFVRVLVAGNRLKDADEAIGRLPAQLSPPGQLVRLQTKADLALARTQWAEARNAIEALLQLAPLNGTALLTLGRTYAAEENLPRAQLAFEAAYRIPESTLRASLELANLELKNRHYAKTVEYLEKALSIEKTEVVQDYLARVKPLVAQVKVAE